MKRCLADVNVWLALALGSHVFHDRARAWWESDDSETIGFCRFTQLGLLRISPLVHGHLKNPECLVTHTRKA